MNDNKWSDEWSTISIKRTTKNRLKALGSFDENWDDLLKKLADFFEEHRMDEMLNNKGK